MTAIPEEFQQEFNNEIKTLGVKRLLLACYTGIFFMPLFNVLDFFVAPDLQLFFLKLRLITVAILGTTIILVKFNKRLITRYLFAFSFFGSLSVSTPTTIMIHCFGGHESSYYAGLILVIICLGIIFPWNLAQGGIVFGTMYGGYIGSIFLLDNISNRPVFIANNFFLLPCIIYALISLYINHNYRKKEFLSRIELTQAKDTIQEAFTKLKKVDQMKTDFVSSVSHELRTPLTSVIGFASNTLKIFTKDIIPQLPETDDKLKKKSHIINDNLSIIVSEAKRLT
ncbi:MAG: histidine kinase dimerization/phospho-acceptor domain-containing protein, partial [Candidatus Anammoxibacter sp.]